MLTDLTIIELVITSKIIPANSRGKNYRFMRTSVILLLFPFIFFGCQTQKADGPQKLYNMAEIPIVDMHTHLDGLAQFAQTVKTMDEWGGTISITLNHNDTSVLSYIKDSLNNRILLAERGIHLTPGQVQKMQDQGYVGLKSHLRYHTLLSEFSSEQLSKMGELGMPFIAMHIADPPEDVYYNPDKFMVHQQDAERIIRRHPETNFIMAHGFYLTNRDSDIDTLRRFFERNPNLYVDIVCSKWWDAPQPAYLKLRKLLIDYKDRFLFGTDYKVARSAPAFRFLREKLETDKPLTFGMNGGPTPGLALPPDVLNRIYYWNAAKIIPGVKETLMGLGYEISDTPPVASPVVPGLDYNPAYITVIEHPDSSRLSGNFPVRINLAAYGRPLTGRLEILNIKKEVLQTLYAGTFDGNMAFAWDEKNSRGEKVGPGTYRVWLILEGNKCAETVFELF